MIKKEKQLSSQYDKYFGRVIILYKERFKRCRLSSVVRRRRRRRRPSSVPIEFPRKYIIYIAALGRYVSTFY